ncbi:MerR family transcriptional regulator [Gilvibacter sp.]|jgi:DNA-binding transcriptional MerR regulator|uniref:MerR family transcriptional regulator n=1 Tax=Gilvibacter sp. TaxID=2729997 RepID=UPI003B51FBE4
MLVKTQFNIKDLENLSGVKAHTIRIWEKRYGLLEPNRTDTNIRKYDLDNLKKLLNVTFLYNEGIKISKIAKLSEEEIQQIIEERATQKQEDYAMKAFKTAMFDFDYTLFATTFNELSERMSFREIFMDVFIPLLQEIGTLWQTGTIDPAHERFISELIKQKIIVNISNLQSVQAPERDDILFSLYLPYEEIHEIGLLYAHYEILQAGYQTIYLGSNIPLPSLRNVLKHHDNVVFVSFFTVKPDKVSLYEYLKEYDKIICKEQLSDLWLMGAKTREVEASKVPEHVSVIGTIEGLLEKLNSLKKS